VEQVALDPRLRDDRARWGQHGLADRRRTRRRHRLGAGRRIATAERGRSVSRDALRLRRPARHRADAADPGRIIRRADRGTRELHRYAARRAACAHAARHHAGRRRRLPQHRFLRLSHPPDHERHSRPSRRRPYAGGAGAARGPDAVAFLPRVQEIDRHDAASICDEGASRSRTGIARRVRQSHFTRAFRQYAGQTPSGWRHTIQ
jgi:hypothetical protein